MGVEIEKKFTVREIPFDLDKYSFHEIEQGYLNVQPAIRVRREDDAYYMTYKGAPKGQMLNSTCGSAEGVSDRETDAEGEKNIGQTEYNLPLDEESYLHLCAKADGNIIRKRRYLIPLNEDSFTREYLLDNPKLSEMIKEGRIMIELDVFKAPFDGRILAEVEFPSEEAARNYNPAGWFLHDVTGDRRYSNSTMSREIFESKK